MRRPTLRGIAAALLLATALSAAAVAATFEGRAADDRKVKVEFRKSSGEIKRFRIERARFGCSHRKPFRERLRAGEMRVTERSRFRGRFTDSRGTLTLRIQGELEGGQARGTFRATVYYRLGHCQTGRVEWRAHPINRR